MTQQTFQLDRRIIDRNTKKRVSDLQIEAMHQLERYRSCIQTLLEKHSQFQSRNEDVENQLFFDPVRDRDRLMQLSPLKKGG
jgi:XisI protein